MRKSILRLALAGAAVTALAAGAAVAQVPPPPPPPPSAPMPPPPPMPPLPPMEALMAMGPEMGDMMMMRHHAPDPEKRAQRLRDILQLRSDQDGALKAYVEATTPKMVVKTEEAKGPGRKDGEMMGPPEMKPLGTLERLDHMTKAADALKKRAEATRAFYMALTPAQQKTFDILGMGEGREGGEHVFIRRFDTHGPQVFKDGERRVIIQRKVG